MLITFTAIQKTIREISNPSRLHPILMPYHRTEKKWVGKLNLGLGWAHYRGPVGDTHPHRHYPLQAIFSADVPLAMNVDGSEKTTNDFTVIPSNTFHQLRPTHHDVDIVYAEPTLVPPQLLQKCNVKKWCTYLSKASRIVSNGKIERALTLIEEQLISNITLENTALQAGMSKSSFSNKFRNATGLPLRRYVLWRRLCKAVHLTGKGNSLTQAAHEAGFSDSAHFSRTMKQTFGVSPSQGVLNINITIAPDHSLEKRA
ncbi:helix-turn-helix transcriptional regulator [Kordiimonas sp. SCSIO 12603]|uniref:helix-turn-helix transcriptional regulator n=1 Tax=Kordiimonas sp. SCSIO 12603 TaxID=2829596 RepID=UPI002107B65D|nr:AraC family transcriptional regulator [Kordiimonas sp. SCSIO 12603]UTW59458.1 helix-turn-helix transcriptional regulator [Kordiimonas sp. SCSIO 12603]